MVTGYVTLLVALAATGLALMVNLLGLARRQQRWLTAVAGLLVTVAAGQLLARLLGHDFSLALVHDYTRLDLPWPYTVAALWAGEAGSLLLWAWLVAVAGVVLAFTDERRLETAPTTTVVLAVQGFLLLLLVAVANPFASLPPLMPPEVLLMPTGRYVPPDGAGLNPFLQSPWQLVHPPLIFLGYAALTVTFAYGLAGRWSGRETGHNEGRETSHNEGRETGHNEGRETGHNEGRETGHNEGRETGHNNETWTARALPWALLAFVALSLGMATGAVWAYESLGWGGYWAWDPVENASLVPWLTATALLHTLVLNRYRGGGTRAAFWLAVISFELVLYATFLARSGITASLHTYAASPLKLYLLPAMALVLLLAFIAYGRGNQATGQPVDSSLVTSLLKKEAVLLFTVTTLLALAFIVAWGTTYGAFSEMVREVPAYVKPAYYVDSTALPALLLAGLLALCPLLSWGRSDEARWRRQAAGLLVVTVVAGGMLLTLGSRTALWWVLAVAGLLALGTNGWQALRRVREGRGLSGGLVSHVGVGLLLAGVVVSGGYRQTRIFSVGEGETYPIGSGYGVEYLGSQREELPDRIVYRAEVRLRRDGRPVNHGYPAFSHYPDTGLYVGHLHRHVAWDGDVRLIFQGVEGGLATFKAEIVPFVGLVWLGMAVGLLGAALALWNRIREGGRP